MRTQMHYDDDSVLTEYIWFNYTHLMTHAELYGTRRKSKTRLCVPSCTNA